VHHLRHSRSIDLAWARFDGRALLNALHWPSNLHGELVCHVLDRLAPCDPHHRTALTPGCGYGQTLGYCRGMASVRRGRERMGYPAAPCDGTQWLPARDARAARSWWLRLPAAAPPAAPSPTD